MDSAKFNYIRTIAECKSISKASQKLHISQPALTRYVNKLEDELGVKLLDRTTLPIKLTYAGEWYIKRVQQILDINSCMQKELQEIVNLERGQTENRHVAGASGPLGSSSSPGIYGCLPSSRCSVHYRQP